jgi:predicted GNAT family acetyltransferase
MNTAIVVDTDGATAAPFAEVIDSEAGMAGVRGSCEVMAGLRSHLRRHVCTNWEDSWFLRLDAPPACTRAAAARARRAREVDIDGLAALYGSAGAMYRTRENVASKVTTGRVFVVEEPGLAFGRPRIVSCALLNIEGHDAGLIGGVFTMPSARGRGCAAACTASLSLDLQADGKIPCLFYENPVAGRVYRRLGFTGGGHWAVFFLSPVRGSAVRAPHQ